MANILTRERLRALVDLGESGDLVVSMYVDLDASQWATPAARETQLNSLYREAVQALDSRKLRRAVKEGARAGLDAVMREIEEADLAGAAGLAVFARGDRVIESFVLARPVQPQALVDERPLLEPLVRQIPNGEWCLFLVNGRAARIVRGEPGRWREVATVEDDVHGRHSQGGWSQARYERSVEKEIEDHYKHAAQMLYDEYERAPFDRLGIATPEEQYPQILNSLHSYVLSQLAGRFDCDVQNSTIEEIVACAEPLMREMERKREEAVLDRLRMDLGKGSGAVAAPPDVRRALDEMRVGTLILAPGSEKGANRVIDLALAQDAEVIVLEEKPDELQDCDGIAALLRF